MQIKHPGSLTFRPALQLCAICLLGGGLLLAGSQAQAHTFCVANATQLQSALTAASDGGMYNGEDTSINLESGAYVTSGLAFTYVSNAATGYLILTGGYGVGCGVPTFDPSLTVLDGNHATKVLDLLNKGGEVFVLNMTIQNGESSDSGGGVSINYEGGFNQNVLLERCIIRNNHSQSPGGGFYIGGDGSGHFMSLQNNLIYGNSADTGGGAAGYFDTTLGGVSVINNTVTQNTTAANGATGGIVDNTSGGSTFQNNILWNNTNFALYLASANSSLLYNDCGAINGAVPGTSTGNLSVNPNFVDAAGKDFRLAGNSPLLGATPQPNTGNSDILGHPYPASGRADLGAYEETIFTDGFEGN